jgi:hypothetical protein
VFPFANTGTLTVCSAARVCAPSAPVHPSLRVAEYAGNESAAVLAATGLSWAVERHELAGKNVAPLARAVPRADKPREQNRRTAQAARRRACTWPRRGLIPLVVAGALDVRVACAVDRVRVVAAQHLHSEEEDVRLVRTAARLREHHCAIRHEQLLA